VSQTVLRGSVPQGASGLTATLTATAIPPGRIPWDLMDATAEPYARGTTPDDVMDDEHPDF
jgi:hypothetical protein